MVVLSIFLCFFGLGQGIETVLAQKQTYPRLANYYLAWRLSEQDVEVLAKWDVVILDMENQVTNPEALKKLRVLNPNIKLLAYVTAQEIRDDALSGVGELRKKLASGIKPEWYFLNLSQEPMRFFPGTSMLNMTSYCPVVDHQKWSDYLANFVAHELQPSGLWDGVFYDNAWQDVSWFTKGLSDADRDGKPDVGIDEAWQSEYRSLFRETRRLAGPSFLIVGNMGPGHTQYRDELNGAMFELFPQFGWPYAMKMYDYQTQGPDDRLLIINGSTPTSTERDYRLMRYTFASTLLKNGYFSFDRGSEHDQLWWYDEYRVRLGRDVSVAKPVVPSAGVFSDKAIWRRDFEYGLALVNPSSSRQTIALGTDFEKISGTDDRSINDGRIVDRVGIGPFDGLILLKTFETVTGSVFSNGAFTRFFTLDGYRARNGVFLSDERAVPGDLVYNGDMTGDGTAERIVVSGSAVRIFNHEGALLATLFPYGSSYAHHIELAVGRLRAGQPYSLVVAPRVGGEVVVYSHIGELVKRFSPLGHDYQGGFTVAIASLDGNQNGSLILGTGPGVSAEVLVYAADLETLTRRFSVFSRTYMGGTELSAGDLQGDGKAEIIVYPQAGVKRRLEIYSGQGKKITDYAVRGVLGSFEARLGVADVNHDGIGEILFISK
jgi:hypothetical protein